MRDAITLIPQLAPRHFHRRHAERALIRFPGLASDAAAVALRAARLDTTLELLEQGRGVLLERELETRGDISELRARAPHLAERFDNLRRRLDQPEDDLPTAVTLQGDQPRHSPGSPEDLGDAWNHLIREIQAMPGLGAFLRPPSSGDLTAVAAAGPVIAINVSQYGADALLVTTAGLRVVPLPLLSPDAVDRNVASYAESIAVAHDELAPLSQRRLGEDNVRTTLAWLWDTIAEPVLAELNTLGYGSEQRLPRVWWLPTGRLNFLPLHAAGHYPPPGTDPADPGRRSLLDRVVSSYTPTLRALLRARRPAAKPTGYHPLVVAVPNAAGQRYLTHAHAEADAIISGWPHSQTLVASAATQEAVLSHLPAAKWVHFACHGHSDTVDPSRSHLVLHDGRLSVTDISRLQIQDAEFAMLSACSTARGGTALPDESIHLTAAFHLAGYRHVIGTMWPVADDAAHRLTTQLYERLQRTPGAPRLPAFDSAALALHDIVRQQRRVWPYTPSVWTSWIHVGA